MRNRLRTIATAALILAITATIWLGVPLAAYVVDKSVNP